MAKEFDDSLFEDVPIEESKMKDDLFEDEQFDESLFEETKEKTTEDKVLDAVSELSPSLTAGGATYGAGAALDKFSDQADSLRGLAEDFAYDAASPNKKLLKEFLERSPEAREKMLIKPRDVGRKALDEGALFPSRKKLDKLKDVSEESRKKLQDFLSKADAKIDPKDLLKKYQEIANKEATGSIAKPDIALKKLVSSKQEVEDFLESAGSKELLPSQVEEMKKKIKFDPGAENAVRRAEDIKKRVLQQTTEDLVGQSGLDIEEFKKLKKAVGEEAIIEKGLISQLGDGKSNVPQFSPYGVRAAPEIELPRGIAEKYGRPIAAKGADITAGIAKKARPFAKILKGIGAAIPVLGAGATYAAEKAEGATTAEAAGRTALEEAGDLILPVGLALRSGALEPQKDSLEYKLERGELTPQEQRELMFDSSKTSGKPMSLEQIQQLKSKLKDVQTPSAKEMYNELNEAEEGDPQDKAQAEYKLKQQPAFKEYLRRLEAAKKRGT